MHEDVLSVSTEVEHYGLVPSSVRQMESLAEKFFDHVDTSAFTMSFMKDFESSRAIFAEACALSHLR